MDVTHVVRELVMQAGTIMTIISSCHPCVAGRLMDSICGQQELLLWRWST